MSGSTAGRLPEGVIAPEPDEAGRIKELVEALEGLPESARCRLSDPEHAITLELPRSLLLVLAEAARRLARGESVAIVHYDQELTTQEAADVLGVSRPYLIRLLEEGKIRYHRVGTHRRIRMGDLMRYKEIRDARRRASLAELVRVSETLGLYDDEAAPEA